MGEERWLHNTTINMRRNRISTSAFAASAAAALFVFGIAPECVVSFVPTTPVMQTSVGQRTFSCSLQNQCQRTASCLHVKRNPSYQRKVSSVVSPLHNIPLEEALEMELLEMEAELDLVANKKEPRTVQQQIKATDAASIIAGTAIGGGFLALPSVTSPLGYGPAALGIILAWTFLMLSATAFIEAAGLVSDVRDMENNGVGDGSSVEGGPTSVATVIRYAFGKKMALVGGSLFIAQMVAVVCAQVVKGAELFSDCLGIPYVVGCLVPTSLAGWSAFGSRPQVVERANTVLTAMMVGGFAALIIGTMATGNVGKVAGSIFARADYGKLLPRSGGAWALPVFINMLCFGQSMPLVVERMVQGSSVKSKGNDDNTAIDSTANDNTANDNTANDRGPLLLRARSATVLGAAAPLVLSVTWAAISTALVDPSVANPLGFLLSRGPAIAIPVALLATGAIGTTLLGSFLAMGHFASDIVCMKLGYCSLLWMKICNASTVAIPSILACVGPSLYLPLLAFAGAYPTTILHALAPALAAIALRRRVRKAGIKDGVPGTTPQIVPGGEVTLFALASTAMGLIVASTWLALRHLVHV